MTDAISVAGGVDRRRFIGGAVAAALGAGVLAGPGRGVLDLLPFVGDGPAPFTRTEVLARIGETFRISDGAHAGVRLVVDGVAELPNMRAIDVPDDQFAARFVLDAGTALAAETYTFVTDSFGDLPLFVSPLVDADGTVQGYEALVNRHVPGRAANTGAAAGGRP